MGECSKALGRGYWRLGILASLVLALNNSYGAIVGARHNTNAPRIPLGGLHAVYWRTPLSSAVCRTRSVKSSNALGAQFLSLVSSAPTHLLKIASPLLQTNLLKEQLRLP